MSDEYGPPTLEDDAWYTHAVVSLDYPKVKRGDKPMEGQESFFPGIYEVGGHIQWADGRNVQLPSSLVDAYSAEELDRKMAEALDIEREWADEQRARDDERN